MGTFRSGNICVGAHNSLGAQTGSVVPLFLHTSRGQLASVRISGAEFSTVLGDALQRVISGERNSPETASRETVHRCIS